MQGSTRPGPGVQSKRRIAIGALLAIEAIWFGAGLGWTFLSHTRIDGLIYPASGWSVSEVELAAVQAASTGAVVVLAVLVLRGSNLALTAALILASVHVVIQVAWSLTGVLLFPYYLLLVSLPIAAPFVLAAPIVLLCLSVRKSRSLQFPADR